MTRIRGRSIALAFAIVCACVCGVSPTKTDSLQMSVHMTTPPSPRPPPPPSLLVACPSTPFFFPGDWVSMEWMRGLVHDAGVQVDYTTSLGDLNRTRLFS